MPDRSAKLMVKSGLYVPSSVTCTRELLNSSRSLKDLKN